MKSTGEAVLRVANDQRRVQFDKLDDLEKIVDELIDQHWPEVPTVLSVSINTVA